MNIAINPEWQRLLPYALGGALLLFLLFSIPFIGRILRALLSIGLLAIGLLVLAQRIGKKALPFGIDRDVHQGSNQRAGLLIPAQR